MKEKLESLIVSPTLELYSLEATIKSKSILIPMAFKHNTEMKLIKSEALLDSGTGGIFIDQHYVRKLGLEPKTLETPMKAKNVDGTINKVE